MRVFIFNRINHVSCNYHTEGGLVIIANDIDHAKEIIASDSCILPTEEEWSGVVSYELAENYEPKYYAMPDAGCC